MTLLQDLDEYGMLGDGNLCNFGLLAENKRVRNLSV